MPLMWPSCQANGCDARLPSPHSPCHAEVLGRIADELIQREDIAAELGRPITKRGMQVFDDGTPSPLTRVISGGQVGADLIGLQVARKLGLLTGGSAPGGWRVHVWDPVADKFVDKPGGDPGLADYGLVEHADRGFAGRTEQNVVDSDATVIYGKDLSSGGTALTISLLHEHNKPYLLNPTPTQLRRFIVANKVKTLNVAGNRSFKNSGLVEAGMRLLWKAAAWPSGSWAPTRSCSGCRPRAGRATAMT